MSDFDQPCTACRDGMHDACAEGVCGCIAPHQLDDAIMRGFKVLKRELHPEREGWTRGGWSERP